MKQLTAGTGDKKRVMYVLQQSWNPAFSVAKNKLPSKKKRDEHGIKILARIVVSGPSITTTAQEYYDYYNLIALKAAGEYTY